jgi:leader peptidase (prepilin peptidase)/N-methyltransferase
LICDIAGFRFGPQAASFAEAAFGAFFPALSLWFLGWLFEKIRHIEGLGFGDVKMIAMVGAFLGLQGALFTVILGSVAGSIIGLAWIKITKADAGTFQLPFATFLGAAALFAAIRAA